ncbi:MAG: cobaltochelatase subunit CobN, partial [Acidiphilium sp.]|nr:cobaltochelatase subunit CobN [Acidiphilium sp.]
MHLLVRETATLDEEAQAVDLGQSPADLVFLSFSDADLGAMADAWRGMVVRPGLRLANLVRLRHPLSVDLYVEQVIARAKCVVVRILGGVEYWRYGVEEVASCCAARGIALVMLEGDGRVDARLAAVGAVDGTIRGRLAYYLRIGGPANCAAALGVMAHLAGVGDAVQAAPAQLAQAGVWREAADAVAVVVFYRSHLLAGDVEPVEALLAALAARGMPAEAWFVASLKDAESARFVRERMARVAPLVVLNATGFSA